MLHLLITGWTHLTIDGAWLTGERWERFPLFFLAAFLFVYGLEVALGPVIRGTERKRLLISLGLLVVVWLALIFGIVWLHSGETCRRCWRRTLRCFLCCRGQVLNWYGNTAGQHWQQQSSVLYFWQVFAWCSSQFPKGKEGNQRSLPLPAPETTAKFNLGSHNVRDCDCRRRTIRRDVRRATGASRKHGPHF